jgi:hypothetical protein
MRAIAAPSTWMTSAPLNRRPMLRLYDFSLATDFLKARKLTDLDRSPAADGEAWAAIASNYAADLGRRRGGCSFLYRLHSPMSA